MRKTIGFTSLLLVLAATAQQPIKKAVIKPAPAPEAAASQLPVTRVSLYKNGVGFFEHSGRVTGNQPVTIDFTTSQLNDVLQSLTAIDLNGGRIAGADYNSTTPLEQQLKALPLALGEQPTAIEFYNAIRGARVEVHSGAVSTTGRLLNIETSETPEADSKPSGEKRLITVVSDSGEVRTVELTPATSVRLLDTALHTDVSRYLQLLASTRNQGLRHLTLQANGTGARELHVSYISEVPIWKSTYRILFTEAKSPKQTATLQGWSVVDNTTGSDWNNVQLSLIAGAPQSFIQPLSVPYYSRRPEVPLPQEAQLSPQTHDSGEVANDMQMFNGNGPLAKAQAAPAAGLSAYGSINGLTSGSGSGIGAGSGSNFGGGLRRVGGGVNMAFEQAAVDSLRTNATTAAFDDYFAYNLTDPITIRKNESALVPILQTKVDAERVTLWSQQQPTPLRALWITNTSNLTLDRGSFTIVENGSFGGEGLLDPIHPSEKRLLSYAVDQAIRITPDYTHNTQRVNRISISKGVLKQRSVDITEVEYIIHNAAADARTVVLERPVRNGWTVDSDPKPVETTGTVNRFRVEVQPNQSVRLHIGERHPGVINYQLTNLNDNQFTFILSQTGNNPALRQALEPILAARRHIAEVQGDVDKINVRLTTLRSDEDRQRANVTALNNADRTARERFVHDLNATEDQIAAAQKDLATAQANLDAVKADLANKIESLQMNEDLPAASGS
ncbi:MAG TPA: DUF4139 domain-containing protein [Acidobacteriaceae bacterium]|nr:DUF4139 domain-containing protein [Acidobacteriaceae bacterium]